MVVLQALLLLCYPRMLQQTFPVYVHSRQRYLKKELLQRKEQQETADTSLVEMKERTQTLHLRLLLLLLLLLPRWPQMHQLLQHVLLPQGLKA